MAQVLVFAVIRAATEARIIDQNQVLNSPLKYGKFATKD